MIALAFVLGGMGGSVLGILVAAALYQRVDDIAAADRCVWCSGTGRRPFRQTVKAAAIARPDRPAA